MSKGSSGTYYLSNKERLQEKSQERYQSLLKEEKKIATICCKRYKNLPEDVKENLIMYRKKYYKMGRNSLL